MHRSADNTYTVSDTESLGSFHKASQIVSGLLWDLHENEQFNSAANDSNEVLQVAYDSVPFLISNSGLHDFVLSLLMADNARENGNCQLIYDAAVERDWRHHFRN